MLLVRLSVASSLCAAADEEGRTREGDIKLGKW